MLRAWFWKYMACEVGITKRKVNENKFKEKVNEKK